MLVRRLGLTHQVVKTSLAAGVAWSLATRISPSPFPYFAPLAVIVTSQATLADTMVQAVYRVAGILLGVTVSLLLGYWLRLGPLAITLATLIGMAVPTAFGLHRAVVSQVGVTALMVLAVRDPRQYALYRVLESALGALVGVAVNALIVPNDIPLAEQRIARLAKLLAESLRAAWPPAAADAEKVSPEHLAARIEKGTADAYQALRSAEASGRLNPLLRGRAVRLKRLSAALKILEKVAIQVWGITLGLADLAADGEVRGSDFNAVLNATAACIVAFTEAHTEPTTNKEQRLKAIRASAGASQAELRSRLEGVAKAGWGDLGATLTDLKRILREIDSAAT